MLVLALLLVAVSAVSAATYSTDSSGITYGTNPTTSNYTGMKIYTGSSQLYIYNLTMFVGGITADHAYILENGTMNSLYNVSLDVTSAYATFNGFFLQNNTYYYVAVKKEDGTGYNYVSTAGETTYPIVGTNLQYVTGLNHTSEYSKFPHNVYTLSSISHTTFPKGWNNVSVTYNSTALETSLQGFALNITYNSTQFTLISSSFNYNGQIKTTTKAGTGDNITFTASAYANQTGNIPFYWTISLTNSTGTYVSNSTAYLQTVEKIYLRSCDATYSIRALNFTAYDERNLTRILPFNFFATFNYGFGTSKTSTSSINNQSISEVIVCISPAYASFYTDAIIEYAHKNETNVYTSRHYYFQNALMNNQTQNISLYLLDATESTSFIIKVQDQKLSSVKGAIVLVQRYYPQDGKYRTVQIARTDDNGETISFYETETAIYKHIIMKEGVILLETNGQEVVGKEVPYTLTFTVGEALNIPWSIWEDNPNIQTSLTFNSTTNITTFTYIDVTGATAYGRLLVTQENAGNSTTIIICDVDSTSSAASLTCDVTGYEGSIIARGYIETTSNVVQLINFIISTARTIFDKTGLIIGWFIILTMAMVFIWNPTAGIVGVNAALWFVNIIGFISFSPIFLFAILAVSIITIWLLKT